MQASLQRAEDQPFTPTGLLGRTYSQRQQMQRSREVKAKNEGAFVDGPSLVGSQSGSRLNRSRGSFSHNDQSVLAAKPLLNVSDSSLRASPQHGRKGDRQATAPMLDLNDGPHFTPGSLLSKVESARPVGSSIDREQMVGDDDGDH